jgi:hypothetical protein
MWDDNWRKLIAGSKFKQWKTFGTFKKGRIASPGPWKSRLVPEH